MTTYLVTATRNGKETYRKGGMTRQQAEAAERFLVARGNIAVIEPEAVPSDPRAPGSAAGHPSSTTQVISDPSSATTHEAAHTTPTTEPAPQDAAPAQAGEPPGAHRTLRQAAAGEGPKPTPPPGPWLHIAVKPEQRRGPGSQPRADAAFEVLPAWNAYAPKDSGHDEGLVSIIARVPLGAGCFMMDEEEAIARLIAAAPALRDALAAMVREARANVRWDLLPMKQAEAALKAAGVH